MWQVLVVVVVAAMSPRAKIVGENLTNNSRPEVVVFLKLRLALAHTFFLLEWQEYFSQCQNMTDALPCHIHLIVCLWIMDPHSRAPKNSRIQLQAMEMRRYRKILHISYTDQRGSPCQDPAGNWTTIRPPDHWWHCKETQTVVVWSCLPLIRSGQNNPARHSERGKKTRQTEDKVPEGSGE